MIDTPRHPSLPEDFDIIRRFEEGYHLGYLAGWKDASLGLRSNNYDPNRDTRPDWWEQGYNNGYVTGHGARRSHEVTP